ncbi:hypothetical protein BDW62DRAFT_200469 [Aspergillus aurantiobrunneus]
MEPLFDDSHFWKSRFRRYGERGYLSHMLEGPLLGQEYDTVWQLLYRASSRLGKEADTALKVYEVAQWIRDKYRAEARLQEPPLDFYGRALQHYHSNSCVAGRRIERVKISPSLVQTVTSLVTGPVPDGRQLSDPRGWCEPASEIRYLEFINKDGSSVTVSERDPGTPAYSAEELDEQFVRYYAARPVTLSSSQRLDDDPHLHHEGGLPEWPLDGHGVHVLLNARSFKGFSMLYSPRRICALGILQKRNARMNKPSMFGCERSHSRWYDIVLDKVTEVVATFEGQELVDLGLRGSGVRQPVSAKRPRVNQYDVDILRYGEDEANVRRMVRNIQVSGPAAEARRQRKTTLRSHAVPKH